MASTTNGLDNTWLEQLPFRDYYIYSPLQVNSFRLFELYPGEGEDVVRGRLVHTNLDLEPCYEAISYHWGDRRTRTVEVDGFMLHTTQSTESALQQVRKRDEARCVWIDAVCIDQEDLLERGRQVKLMAKLYSGADHVLICINDPATRELKELLEAIHAAFEPVDRIPRYPVPSRRFFNNISVGLTGQEISAGIRSMKSHLCNLLPSSPEVTGNEGSVSEFEFNFCSAKTVLASWGDRDFWEILHRTSFVKASEPRDKIFALLGHPSALTSNGSRTLIQPDYQKSVGQVYFEFTCSMMQGSRPLRVLSSVLHPTNCSDRELSWIPRWHNLRLSLFSLEKRFNCTMDNSANFEIQDDQKTLKVQGILFDTITYVSRVMRKRARGGFHKHFPAIWTELQQETQSYWQAYLHTLTANKFSRDRSEILSPLVPDGDIEESFRQVLLSSEELGLVPSMQRAMESPPDDLSARDKAVLYFIELAQEAVDHRCFARSHRGHYGLVPAAAKENDVICILFGSTVPFILRSDGALGTWRLVGECYLHGIMYGEGIEMLREGLLEEQIFHILG